MRFSVIIPLYNKAPYIKKALESVINQSYNDFELVVVDDGSTDGSCQIAEETLKGVHVDYHLIKQHNAGVSTARNNGVKASHGDFICFLDADDWWAPTFLEKMNSFINDYPDAGIYGTNYYYVKNGRQRVCVTTAERGYINYCKVYADRLAMPLTSISVAIKRDVFCAVGGFNPKLKLGEDFDLWIRISLCHKVAFLNEPLAYYFQDSAPQWRGTGRLQEPQFHMLWNLGYMEEEERNNPDYKRLIDELRTYSLLPYYLSTQYREAAKKELAKVDWSKQPKQRLMQYRRPIQLIKIQRTILRYGSAIKQWLIKHL